MLVRSAGRNEMAEVRPRMLYFGYEATTKNGKQQLLRLKIKAAAC